jgi:hypothetical protein
MKNSNIEQLIQVYYGLIAKKIEREQRGLHEAMAYHLYFSLYSSVETISLI